MQFSFFGALGSILASSGFASFAEDPRSLIMIIIACVLLYMGIGKKFEPLLLVPIAFGMLLANLPLTGLLTVPVPVCCGCSIRASSMRFIRPSSSSASVP